MVASLNTAPALLGSQVVRNLCDVRSIYLPIYTTYTLTPS